MRYFNVWRNLNQIIKNVGQSISSGTDDKFKSVFKILVASLDKFVCLAKNTSIIQYPKSVRPLQKITVPNNLKLGQTIVEKVLKGQ